MAIDWTATGTWMQAWAGFAGAGSVIYAAHKGAATYRSWVKQKKGELKIDAANRILTATYKVRIALRSIRARVFSEAELGRAWQTLTEDQAVTLARDDSRASRFRIAQAMLLRIKGEATIWDDLLACMPVARAFFGEDAEQLLEKLWRHVSAIQIAASSYGLDGDDRQLAVDLAKDMFDDHPLHGEGENTTSSHLISQIETILLPALRDDASD